MSSTSSNADSSTTFHGQAYHSKKGPFKEYSYNPRKLGPNDVEVEISHCGVCASDQHTVTGGWGDCIYPCIPGHEIVGKIKQVGSDAKLHKAGDLVGVGPHVLSCMQKDCRFCSNGQTNLCSKMVLTYNSKYPDGEVSQGGYATGIRVHENYAYPIPKEFKPEEAAPLLCAGVTVYAPLKRYKADKGMKVGVIGIGGLGHLAVQFAHKMGAHVVAISSSKKKADDAKKLGADEHVDFSNDKEFESVKGKLDLVICTANAKGMDYEKYLELCVPAGTFVLVGLPEEKMNMMPSALVMKQISLVGTIVGSVQETKDMLDFAAKNNVKPLIDVLPMGEANKAFERLEKGDVHFRLVLKN